MLAYRLWRYYSVSKNAIGTWVQHLDAMKVLYVVCPIQTKSTFNESNCTNRSTCLFISRLKLVVIGCPSSIRDTGMLPMACSDVLGARVFFADRFLLSLLPFWPPLRWSSPLVFHLGFCPDFFSIPLPTGAGGSMLVEISGSLCWIPGGLIDGATNSSDGIGWRRLTVLSPNCTTLVRFSPLGWPSLSWPSEIQLSARSALAWAALSFLVDADFFCNNALSG